MKCVFVLVNFIHLQLKLRKWIDGHVMPFVLFMS